MNYGASFYRKVIGKEETGIKAVTDLLIKDLRDTADLLARNIAAQNKLIEKMRRGENPFLKGANGEFVEQKLIRDAEYTPEEIAAFTSGTVSDQELKDAEVSANTVLCY